MTTQQDEQRRTGGPLSGLKVIELGAMGPVPLAGAILSDMGADIVLVCRPGTTAEGRPLDAVKRGRRVVELDLKAGGEDRDRLLEAVAEADVLLEGFRPGTLERLGLDPEMLLESNPGLVVGRMTGWGQEGPRSQEAGHDINYLSLTGHLAAITDPDGRPSVPLNLVGDYGGGTMFLLLGILSALHERSRSGRGQVIDSAMVDGASMLGLQIWALRDAGRWTDSPYSNLLDGGLPWYGVYDTRDGRHMAVGALEPQFYARLLEGLELTDVAPDRGDSSTWPRLRELFAERFRSEDMEHWTAVFAGTDACVTPVLTYGEALEDEHLRARRTFIELGGAPQPAPAPRFSRTPASFPAWPPRALPADGGFWD